MNEEKRPYVDSPKETAYIGSALFRIQLIYFVREPIQGTFLVLKEYRIFIFGKLFMLAYKLKFQKCIWSYSNVKKIFMIIIQYYYKVGHFAFNKRVL